MPVFAFAGNDELRRHEALDTELHRWESSETGAVVRETHFGEELNAAQVAEAYQGADLFAPRKAVILRNYDKVSAAGQKVLEKAWLDDNPQVAVFLSAEKIDGRSTLAKSLERAGRWFEFKLPYDNKIPAWLQERARQRYGRGLGAAEARLLQDIVGGETAELDRELEKLDTFLPKGEAITAEAIESLVSPLKVYAIFEFQKAMGLRRSRDFLPALRNLLENGTEGFQVVLRLFAHFLTLAKIRTLLDQGAGEHEIVEACRLNQFLHIVKEKYLDQARSRSLARWKLLLARLARLEWEMKQGRYLHRFEIEMALAAML